MIDSQITTPTNHLHHKSSPTHITANAIDDQTFDTSTSLYGQDKDNPNSHIILDGMTWTLQTDGRWKLPDPAPNIPTTPAAAQINKITSTPDITHLAQSDSGANRIVTDSLSALQDVMTIDPIIMGGCNKNDPTALTCTAMGKLPIQSLTGEILLATAYYSEEVDGTIISPTTLVSQFNECFVGWMQYSNCDSATGDKTLVSQNGDDMCFATRSINDLWYHDQDSIGITAKPKINKLNSAAKYELWQQRTGHAGATTLESLHKHDKGVPKLHGNVFYRCPSCMSGKLCTKRSIGKKKKTTDNKNIVHDTPQHDTTTDHNDLHLLHAEPGQHFHIDFGFVRSSDFNYKMETGHSITSIDGKSAYLAIIDRAS